MLGPVGESVIVYTDALGQLHGAMLRHMSTGFSKRASGHQGIMTCQQKTSPKPAKIVGTLVLPKNPTATILVADGSLLGCLVIDYSLPAQRYRQSLILRSARH